MKIILTCIMISLLAGSLHIIADTLPPIVTEDANRLVYVIPIKQNIETGLERFLRRAFREANEVSADYIILDLDTFGGRVDSAEAIGSLIRSSSIPTVVFINGKAISAGSYIALNANQIVMQPGGTIGSASIVDIAGTPIEDAKTISAWVGLMTSAAEINGRNPDYARKMVDQQFVLTVEELDKEYPSGTILNFTTEEALLAGYADGKANNINGVLEFIGAQNYTVIEVEASPAETFARFLTNPIVMTILMLIGIAGIAIELFVPGFGVPGIVGISAFAIYFFGQFVAGFAGVEHLFLFLAGVVLLIVEVFVPSFGIFGIAGIISVVAGVVLAAYDTEQAMLSLAIASVLAIVIIVLVSKYFRHRGIWNKFVLLDQTSRETGYDSQASKQYLMGKTGTTVTPLRPSGTADIDDDRIDVVSNGGFIAINREIIVIKIEGTRVVVREVKT